MDVMILGENSLRIKGRNASIVINPDTKTGKTEAEGIVVLEEYPDFSDAKIEGSRITIKGPGEYEVSGIKISGIEVDHKLVVNLDVDNIKLLIGSGQSIEKIHDKVEGANVAVINADTNFNYSILSSIEPSILAVYGKNKEEVKKSLGKDSETVSKFSTTLEKLPTELQFLILG